MTRLQYFVGKSILIMGSILIGIPAGIVAGLLFFFRVALTYPFQMYRLANDRWIGSKLAKLKQEDMWERHIRRMEEEEKYRKNSN